MYSHRPTGKERKPDQKVHAKEDRNVKDSKEFSLSKLTLSSFKLPLRPGYGTVDDSTRRLIYLKTNYYNMEIDTSINIYRYVVDVTRNPKKTSSNGGTFPGGRRVAMVAYGLLFELPEFQSLDPGIATDYSKIILTVKKLDLGPSGKRTYPPIIYREPEDTVPRQNAITYTFTVTFDKIVSTTELTRYLASAPTDPSNFDSRNDAVAAMNIIMARTPNSNPHIFQAGTNKFFNYPQDPQNYLELGQSLIAVRGYFSSVRTSTSRTLLNVNAQCSPFYPAERSVYTLMKDHSPSEEVNFQSLERFIEKLRVKTTYLKNKDGIVDVRHKTVIGLSHIYKHKGHSVAKGQKQIDDEKGVHLLNATEVTFKCDEFPGQKELSVEQ